MSGSGGDCTPERGRDRCRRPVAACGRSVDADCGLPSRPLLDPRRETEFALYLEQRPGQLAGLLEAATVAGVDVLGVSVTEYQDKGLIRLVGTPADRLRQVCESLSDAGVGPVVENEVISVGIEGRPGALRDLACLLADAEINLRYAYLASGGNGTPARCIVAVDDATKAVQTVENHERNLPPDMSTHI